MANEGVQKGSQGREAVEVGREKRGGEGVRRVRERDEIG